MFTRFVAFAATAISLAAASSAEFSVINTNNSGPGSLRQAMLDANASPGQNRIVFNIPGDAVHTIRPVTALPILTNAVIVDGYTQPGSSPNTLSNANNAVLRIHLDGVSRDRDGLILSGGNSVIRGLVISRFPSGIVIRSASNIVAGNFIGTDPAGRMSLSNDFGIYLHGFCCNVIGGSSPAERNIVSGNRLEAIVVGELPSRMAQDVIIAGNFMGVDATGIVPLENGPSSSTISVRSSSNLVVGGLNPGARNIIAGGFAGVSLYEFASNTYVLGNYIGIGADGVTPIPGDRGIITARGALPPNPICASYILIEANRIAHHEVGIGLPDNDARFFQTFGGGIGITITKNSIFSNRTGGGIWGAPYSRTNDPGDFDTGPNELQNFPEISSAVFGIDTIVMGTLSSRPNRSYTIEFFANRVPHPSGFGEGEIYLGSQTVTTPASGIAFFETKFSQVLLEYPWITATATDAEGNTSIFSPPAKGGSLTQPVFHSQPVGVTTLPGSNVIFIADASGMSPLWLQWSWNGNPLPNATDATLTLTNVQWENRGTYRLTVSNSFGTITSVPAELVIKPEPTILTHPATQIVTQGQTITFTVQVAGTLPIAYQWRWNGIAIPGATGPALALSNIQWTNRGAYSVVLSNIFGVTESQLAELVVRVNPTILVQPISQDVTRGGFATLSVAISNAATAPILYRWRVNGSTVSGSLSTQYLSFFTLTNLQTNVNVTVAVSNLANLGNLLSSTATLNIVADTDQDGLPDAFESNYGLNPNDAADATHDNDHDGRTNFQEYQSSTDPLDPLNRLKVDRILQQGGITILEFRAASNKTYAIQYRDLLDLDSPTWRTLTNVPAHRVNGTEVIRDTLGSPARFYRLVTP